MASAPTLRDGIQLHIEQTQVQIERLQQAMETLDHQCRGAANFLGRQAAK